MKSATWNTYGAPPKKKAPQKAIGRESGYRWADARTTGRPNEQASKCKWVRHVGGGEGEQPQLSGMLPSMLGTPHTCLVLPMHAWYSCMLGTPRRIMTPFLNAAIYDSRLLYLISSLQALRPPFGGLGGAGLESCC